MRWVVSILSKFPLGFLYFMVDALLFPIVYHIVRYRRKLVRKNLSNSFPQKDRKQIKQIERKYYRHLCDIIVEVIYGYGCSDEEMQKRVEIINFDCLAQLTLRHQGSFMMVGHLGNWEWTAQVGARLKPHGIDSVHIYRRLKNSSMDNLMLDIRHKRSSEFVEMKQTLRTMVKQFGQGIPTAYGMVADQKPSPKQKDYFWLTFLGQDTPFLQGTEALARRFDFPVIYGKTLSPKRGYYTIEVVVLTEHPKEEKEGYITQRYAQLLEENILEQPHLWLWSHNRWKYKKNQ